MGQPCSRTNPPGDLEAASVHRTEPIHGAEQSNRDATTGRSAMSSDATIWFDVEDLLHHFRSGHSRPSGIQRLGFEIYRAAQDRYAPTGKVQFVRHGVSGEPPLVPLTWTFLDSIYHYAERATKPSASSPTLDAAETHASPVRVWDRPLFAWMPAKIRRPVVMSSALEAQALASLGRFGLALAAYPVLACPRAIRRVVDSATWFTGLNDSALASFEAQAQPGDILLTLGAPWFQTEYARIVRWARDTMRLHFGALIHDMAPMNRPEWCHEGVIRTFRAWHSSVLPLCDLVLANSRYTARQVEEWARRVGVRLPGPVRAVPIGTGFGMASERPQSRPTAPPGAGNYVLFVSTLEARKNHASLLRVWRRLLDEERSQLRPPGSVPDLVFAGRVGWMVADLMQQLENSSWLGGRVRLVRDPSDAELRALYEGCLFTLFPSLYEGWGLPVSEALSLGVPVLCSSATALPEAGGDLARYFDPEDAGSCYRAVAALLADPEGLAAWRAEVRACYQPTPWSATAQAVLEAAWSLDRRLPLAECGFE
jgi:glycosyltransferase involved in cell wall biosynthesis